MYIFSKRVAIRAVLTRFQPITGGVVKGRGKQSHSSSSSTSSNSNNTISRARNLYLFTVANLRPHSSPGAYHRGEGGTALWMYCFKLSKQGSSA